MVTLVTAELAPEVQMRPPEVMKVSKRDFHWPFTLSHLLQDGHQRTNFLMPFRQSPADRLSADDLMKRKGRPQ